LWRALRLLRLLLLRLLVLAAAPRLASGPEIPTMTVCLSVWRNTRHMSTSILNERFVSVSLKKLLIPYETS
jgi:hypothetical protein